MEPWLVQEADTNYNLYMSQLTIYLPEDLHEKVRKKSKELGISLSSYMASLVSEAFESDTMSELDALFGSY